jgi:hypothetical protein
MLNIRTLILTKLGNDISTQKNHSAYILNIDVGKERHRHTELNALEINCKNT